jgi:hypothetical protein
VVYDPVHNRWCHFVAPQAASHKIKTSSNRTTWTVASAPPGGDWDQDYEGFCLGCSRTTGRIVAMASTTGNKIVVATSDDGGVTWTTRASLPALTFSGTDFFASLTCDETTNVWFYVQGEITGTPTSRVYMSTDGGATWTLVKSLATSCLYSITVFGELLVGLAKTGSTSQEVVWSDDSGVTWHLSGLDLGAGSTPPGIFAGGGGLAIPTNGHVYVSQRTGTPNLGVLA